MIDQYSILKLSMQDQNSILDIDWKKNKSSKSRSSIWLQFSKEQNCNIVEQYGLTRIFWQGLITVKVPLAFFTRREISIFALSPIKGNPTPLRMYTHMGFLAHSSIYMKVSFGQEQNLEFWLYSEKATTTYTLWQNQQFCNRILASNWILVWFMV